MPEEGLPDFQWSHVFSPGVLLLLIGIAGYVVSEPPLKSVRPESSPFDVPQPPHPDSIRAIHGRLWEDPLTGTYRDWEEQQKKLNERAESVAYDRLRKARQLLATILATANNDKKRVLVLPVLVPGGPYVDDAEQRMRMRYAVLSALAACGYKLSFPQRMSYVAVPFEVDLAPIHVDSPQWLVVPLKLFRHSDVSMHKEKERYDYVFVVWINELQLGDRPLAVIGQVIEQLFGTVENERPADGRRWLKNLVRADCRVTEARPAIPRVDIIGPTTSDTFLDMAHETKEWKARQDRLRNGGKQATSGRVYRHVVGSAYFAKYKTHLYSPRATISSGLDSEAQDAYDLFNSNQSSLENGIQSVVRTIGTDAMLVRLIARELQRRGKWVRGQSSGFVPIVLVTEQDTLYGTAFPAAFQREVRRDNSPHVWLKTFKYERGLDGKLPDVRSRPSSDDSDRKPASSTAPVESVAPSGERPTGRSQVDYLRRLESELVAIDSDLRRKGKDGIQAIGVVGTDVYDKLLILRALRKRFPEVCFFTTDLDAALSQKSEFQTARNLVVASHFALRLNQRLQRDVPPFRDSYQTSIYFATLLALQDNRLTGALRQHGSLRDPWGTRGWKPAEEVSAEEAQSRLQPLVFEVGRHGPYQLTLTGANAHNGESSLTSAIHPPSPREQPWLSFRRLAIIVIAVFALLVCLVSFVSTVRKLVWDPIAGRWLDGKRWRVIFAALGVVLLLFGPVVLIWFNHSSVDGEPFAWDEGISLWPATVIRYVIVLSAIGLGALSVNELRNNEQRLRRKYLKEEAGVSKETPSPWTSFRNALRIVLWIEREGPDPQDEQRTLKSILYPWAWRLKRDSSNESDPEKFSATRLFTEYLERGGLAYRLARSIRLSVLYLIFGSLLLWATGKPTRPYRGAWSGSVSLVVLAFSVAFMVWLVFFVLDRMQLCRRFIRLLQESSPDWDSKHVDELKWERNAREQDIRELCTVRLIAEHTNAVMKLVYYPFVIVLLMLVARWPLFDYLNLPFPLLVISLLLLAALLWSAYGVRRAARDAREENLSRMRGELARSTAVPSDQPRAEQLKLFIAEIQREQRGAYGPLVRDPIVGSLALVFGGSGGLLLIERFLPNVIF